jgi:hypothetical protein
LKFFVVFFLILFVVAFSSLEYASAFETHGGPGAVYPWLSAIKIGDHLGLPIHQEITKEGLSFLNDPTKTLLADQHIYMEGDQSSANHFDNCAFSESIAKINYKYRIAVGYLNPKFPQPDKSAEEFGRLLHTVQDFYAHTNWVEMKRTTLVDQGYSYWTDIPSFSLNTGDNQVFSFEVQKNTKTNELVYSKYVNKVIRVKLGDNNYKDIGLISGTYGEPGENKCLPGASVPHGSSVGPYFSFADNEKLNKPDVLNKDHPKQKGHAAARDLAVKQTEHEFCRLVELTRTQWGPDGVDIIYKNWVKNTNIAISKCPIIEKSSTIITDSNTSIGSVQEFLIPNWVKQNAKWWSDGITSDKEFANTMGFLVKEKIITVNIPMNNDGSILVNDNLQIPDWLRNNAKWWSDGTIQDSDFTSGVEYMIKEKVITFSEKNTITEDNFKKLYTINKQTESITDSLIEINQFEKQFFKETIDDMWTKYDKTKNSNELKTIQMIDGNIKNIDERLELLVKTGNTAKQDTKNLIKQATKNKINEVDLEKYSKDKVFKKIFVKTPNTMYQALKDIENANKQNIKTLDDLIWDPNKINYESIKPVSPIKNDNVGSSFDFTVSDKFFKKYYGVTDHIPIKAEYDNNKTVLEETNNDSVFIEEIIKQTSDAQEKPSKLNDKNQVEIIALKIDGNYYPLAQFGEKNASWLCDSTFWNPTNDDYGTNPKIHSIDGFSIAHKYDNCGHGKISETKPILVKVPKEQADDYMKKWFISPYPKDIDYQKYGLTKGTATAESLDTKSHADNSQTGESQTGESQTNTNPQNPQTTIASGPPVKWIVAEIINDEYYPWAQFKIGYTGDTCNDRHVFSIYPKVRSLNGVYLENPDLNHIGCGFGSASSFNEVEDYPITQAQIDSFKADMGFEP